MAITVEQVATAAETIQGRGEKPTLALVRKELGGGSFSTLSDLMRQWRASQAAESELAVVELPESVSEAHRASVAAIWKAAVDEAERRLSGEREALKAAQEESAANVAEAFEALREMEAEAEALKAQLAEEVEAKRKLADELSAAKADLKVAESQLKPLEDRIAEQRENITALIAKVSPQRAPTKGRSK